MYNLIEDTFFPQVFQLVCIFCIFHFHLFSVNILVVIIKQYFTVDIPRAFDCDVLTIHFLAVLSRHILFRCFFPCVCHVIHPPVALYTPFFLLFLKPLLIV